MSNTYQKVPNPIYEGKASRLYEVEGHPDLLIIERKDDITKLDGEVRTNIEGKGAYTNRISNRLFTHLEQHGLPTHFKAELSSNETLIWRTEPLKLEVIVRNIATGSLCKRLPFEDGEELAEALIELDYKDDQYHDPLINDQHAVLLGIAEQRELNRIKDLSAMINLALKGLFKDSGIILVDFKLEFGRRTDTGQIILIDEISPDTCRFWDAKTRQSLDKDIFRKGGTNDETYAAYREIFERIGGTPT